MIARASFENFGKEIQVCSKNAQNACWRYLEAGQTGAVEGGPEVGAEAAVPTRARLAFVHLSLAPDQWPVQGLGKEQDEKGEIGGDMEGPGGSKGTLQKKVTDFPVPSLDVTSQTLTGRE